MSLINFLKKIINKPKLKNIRLLILDVDGVLTDGKLLYSEDGSVSKSFDVKDGLGIKLLQKENINIVFLSGNKSKSTTKRADDLYVKKCFTGIENKLEVIKNIQKELNIRKRETIFCGDDLNDLIILSSVEIFACPSDALPHVKKSSNIVLKNKGGNGSVRELCEMILKEKRLLKKYSYKGITEKN